jgi:hypothetical protein
VVGVVDPGPITGRVEDGSVAGLEDVSVGSTMVVVGVGMDDESIGSVTPTTELGAIRPGRKSNVGLNCRRVRMGILRP